MTRRIETTTSRTAEIMCMSRAASSLESHPCYKSDDHLAVLLLPTFLKLLFKIPLVRALFCKVAAPRGSYEYVIARTKYIDEVFQQVLAEQFDQILLFGAGFDTRAIVSTLHHKTRKSLNWMLLSHRRRRFSSTRKGSSLPHQMWSLSLLILRKTRFLKNLTKQDSEKVQEVSSF
jgi:hypothetical protein